MSIDQREQLVRRYLRFADQEASGVSPLYEALARAVSSHQPTLDFLESLPAAKQQPNLLLAAFRAVAGTPTGPEQFLAELHDHLSEVREVVMSRSVQTNEPGRCATLVPALSRLKQPLALIEVGASAGLCLLPDRYAYEYRTDGDDATITLGSGKPLFPCEVSSLSCIPHDLPEIVWRAGLDLRPISLVDVEQRAWLELLVWPEQEGRRQRLRQAIELALADPPRVDVGDLREDLLALIAESPSDATVVVMHSAVVSYLPSRAEIDDFATLMGSLRGHWISNESSAVFPEPFKPVRDQYVPGSFVLMVDGTPLAFTGPHGQSLDWLST